MNPQVKTPAQITGTGVGTGLAVGADNDTIQLLGLILAVISAIGPLLQFIRDMLNKRKGPPTSLLLGLWVFGCLGISLGLLLAGCAGRPLKPAPPAPGQDLVIINAQRAQITSLEAFQQLDQWEATHRAVLSPEISRAVDDLRDDFPPLWKESRNALAEYKAARAPDPSVLNRITAALQAATLSINRLSATSGSFDLNGLIQSINHLADVLTAPATDH